MLDRPASWSYYGLGEVLDVFEERHAKGEPPFGDVLEAIDFIQRSDLAHIDIGNAIRAWSVRAGFASLSMAFVSPEGER